MKNRRWIMAAAAVALISACIALMLRGERGLPEYRDGQGPQSMPAPASIPVHEPRRVVEPKPISRKAFAGDRFTVVEESSGIPIPGAVLVWASHKTRRIVVDDRCVVADSDGACPIPPPATDSERLFVAAAGFESRSFQQDALPGDRRLKLRRAGRLHFQARDRVGRAVAGVRIAVSRSSMSDEVFQGDAPDRISLPVGDRSVHTASTDGSGDAIIDSVPPGPCKVSVDADDFVAVSTPESILVASDTTQIVDVVMEPVVAVCLSFIGRPKGVDSLQWTDESLMMRRATPEWRSSSSGVGRIMTRLRARTDAAVVHVFLPDEAPAISGFVDFTVRWADGRADRVTMGCERPSNVLRAEAFPWPSRGDEVTACVLIVETFDDTGVRIDIDLSAVNSEERPVRPARRLLRSFEETMLPPGIYSVGPANSMLEGGLFKKRRIDVGRSGEKRETIVIEGALQRVRATIDTAEELSPVPPFIRFRAASGFSIVGMRTAEFWARPGRYDVAIEGDESLMPRDRTVVIPRLAPPETFALRIPVERTR